MKVGELKEALAAVGLPTTAKKGELVVALLPVVERAKVEEAYSKLSNDKLKAMLELNGQKKSGNKEELVERCVDGRLFGALPRCPDCGGGVLRVAYAQKYGHSGQGRFTCPGHYEDEGWITCGFKSMDAERPPWKEPSDVHDQKKKSQNAGGSGTVAANTSPASSATSAPPPTARLPDDDE